MEDRAAEGVDKWNRKKYTKYLEEEKVAQKGDLLSFRHRQVSHVWFLEPVSQAAF